MSDGLTEYDAGRSAMDKGRYEEAIRHFTASLEASLHFKTLELLGECQVLAGRPRDAVVPLAAAVGLNGGQRPAFLLAQAQLNIDDTTAAFRACDEALRRAPHYRRAVELRRKIAVRYAEQFPGHDLP